MKTVKLGNLCNILSGFAFKSDLFGVEGLPLVRIRDVVRGYSDTYYSGDYDEKYILDNGDILVGMDGDFNTAYWQGGAALLNQRVCKIEVDPEKTCKKFIYYFLPLKLKKIWDDTPFVTVKHLSVKKIMDIDVPDWPLETQKKIAAVLEKADQLRKDCQQMEQDLNSLAQSVFIDMFGDPVTNPKGWDKEELLALCTKVTDGTHQSPEWAETGVPFLFISHVRNGKVNFDTGKYITRRCYDELTKTSPIEVDDILYTTVGSYGRVAMVKDSFPDFCFQRHIAHIKPDPNKIIPEFLYYQLQTSGIKHLADLAVKGIAQKTLNLKELKLFELIVPPKEQQMELIEYMEHQYRALNHLDEMKDEHEVLFNSLMQKAFKGELNL